MIQRNPVLSFLIAQTACFAAGYIGSLGTMQGLQGWYQSLAKPAWTPPAWLFSPIWTALYLMIGTALWMVWRKPRTKWRNRGLIFFAVQLALNALWPWLFFAWH